MATAKVDMQRIASKTVSQGLKFFYPRPHEQAALFYKLLKDHRQDRLGANHSGELDAPPTPPPAGGSGAGSVLPPPPPTTPLRGSSTGAGSMSMSMGGTGSIPIVEGLLHALLDKFCRHQTMGPVMTEMMNKVTREGEGWGGVYG